ncbi:MAG: sugar phosphate isomerase/epimerase [Chloroflexota bacterium]|nr:sugar phosphate isomerase/epimerase [Chloroflexota bacterium]
MKLSLSMWSLVAAVKAGQMDLMGFIDFAAAQAVEGVELLDVFWSDAEREIPLVKERIADAGLEMAVYSISNNFIRLDEADRRCELDALKRGVDIALALGVNLMRVFSGSYLEGLSQEEGMSWILEGLSAGAAYAERRGVTLALENHGRFAGRSDQVRDIIAGVGSPALRVNLDTGNFLLMGQDPLEAARDLADMIALVHLKDMRRATAEEPGHVFADPDGQLLTGSVIGAGLVDLPAMIALLEEIGYSGWLSLEYEGAADPVSVGVPRSLDAARRLLG